MADTDTSRLLAHARRLRRAQTDVERKLWRMLRARRFNGAKFRRQVPIGPYVVDFVCPAHRLIVEIDGGQHAKRTAYDGKRSRILTAQGYRIVRFWNNEVLENLNGVLATIEPALKA